LLTSAAKWIFSSLWLRCSGNPVSGTVVWTTWIFPHPLSEEVDPNNTDRGHVLLFVSDLDPKYSPIVPRKRQRKVSKGHNCGWYYSVPASLTAAAASGKTG
jgi:hypothetical protein